MENRNLYLRYFGLAVLIIGIILNVRMFVNNSWPTYMFLIFCIIGLVQIWLSFIGKNITIAWQMFWSLIPFFIFYILILINDSSKDIFLIPEGYRGEIKIEYGVLNGTKKESDGLWRVYRIPVSGKLETQYQLKGGSIDLSSAKYFYIDGKGNKKALESYCETCKDHDTVSVQISSVKLLTGENSYFQTFYVGVPKSIRSK